MTSCRSETRLLPRPRWTREQIQAARRAPLPELLRRQGVELRDRGNGNFELTRFAGIVVKDGYWRRLGSGTGAGPEARRGGNAIDLFVNVLGKSFHEAMRIICEGHVP